MTRRINLAWPVSSQGALGGSSVRLLAVSDEPEPALDFESNRADLGRVDAVLGCGDLEPAYLNFLADAFHAPLLYVRGNHDRGANWSALREQLPQPLDRRGELLNGLRAIGLSWPGRPDGPALRDDRAAWWQSIRLGLRPPRERPLIVLSHMPPLGLNDVSEDHYHRGFAAYHWLCRRLQPLLWLHGHTSLAAGADWRVEWGGTTFVNVTGATLIELGPPTMAPGTIEAGVVQRVTQSEEN